MFEDGSVEDADALVDRWIPTYDRTGILHGHIRWHQALGALEHGDAARALKIYAEVLQPNVTQAPPLNAITDGASLLWRLQAYGHAVPRLSGPKPTLRAQRAFPRSSIPFADVHMALFAAATRNQAALEGAARRDREARRRRQAAGRRRGAKTVPRHERFRRGRLSRLRGASVAGARRGRAHRRQPRAAHAGRGHLYRRADEERGSCRAPAPMLDERLHRRPSPRDTRWLAQPN
jgi:hypothetical protein